ncbi:unnamed protein product [Orchesella dallaii]|uniref:BED-type domain-containing protein n=1 Tax=Orchesella dallaii TaxID=48710 RepID=A0ABP1RPN2_9HEXA
MDNVWKSFHRVDGQPTSKATCNFCKSSVSSRVARLRKHMEVCKSVPGSKSVPDVAPAPDMRVGSFAQRKVSSFVDVITRDQKRTMDYEVGRYIYSTNLPFSHVEHPRFQAFLSKLRPGYKPPTRQTIGSTILDDIYQDVVTKTQESLLRKQVTLMQDGWKARTQDAVISHCLTTGEKAYFLNAVSAGENEKTAEYCVKLLQDAIQLAEDRYNVEVIAVVTDNCNSMRKMRRLLVEEKPDILTYGCHPHLLNLVGKRLTPECLQEKVEKVHKYFRNHDTAAALLKKKNGTRPIMASSIRWNSWIRCFESYLKNQTKFLEVSRMDESRMANEDEIIDILNDRSLYRDVENTIGYLKPIQLALDSLQKENATLADGVSHWLSLQNSLVITDEKSKQYFEKQFERAVTDVGIAAYMLNPKFKGNVNSFTNH